MGRPRIERIFYKKNALLDKIECKHLDVQCGVMVSNNDPSIAQPKIVDKSILGKEYPIFV